VLSKIKSPEDFWSGIMFLAFGLAAVIVSKDYPMGTAMRMGPGYFPTYLGYIMMGFGAIIAAGSFKIQGEGIPKWGFRGMILLTLALLIFGYMMDTVGFVGALIVLITLSSLAGAKFKFIEVLILNITLVIGSWLLFVYGLDLPFRMFPWSY